VTLRWDPPNLILQVKDNGSGIPKARLENSDGVGLDSMRDRAAQMDAKLEIETAVGQGTSIIVCADLTIAHLKSDGAFVARENINGKITPSFVHGGAGVAAGSAGGAFLSRRTLLAGCNVAI
jgi:hypothetical protein